MNNPSTNKVAVVVLNWNGTDDTIACVQSLGTQTYSDFEIVLIDNGSDQEPREKLDLFVAKNDISLTYLKNDKNLGFAGGVNTGIRYALENRCDAIALLNNDAIVDSAWLKSLVSELDRSEVGIVTGALLHEDGRTIDSTGEFYSTWGLAFPRGRNKPANELPDAGYIFGATGGSTLYKTDVFQSIGFFDETFFAYYEDADISFRAQLSGWRAYYTPRAITYHKQGASTQKLPGFGVYQTFKNLPLLYRKNVPKGLRHIIGPRFYLAYSLILLNAIRNGNGAPALKGLLQSIRLIPHSLSERKKIQSNKKVSNDYIKSILWPDLPPEQTGLRKFRKLFTHKD